MRSLARARFGVAFVASLLAVTCSGSHEAALGVSAVTPFQAYNNKEITVVIQGGPFRPAYDIDTGDGRAATQLGAFTAYLSPRTEGGQRVAFEGLRWLSTSALGATLRENVPPGAYDVEVVDPRGAAAELPEGFVSLGRDEEEPKVDILEPAGGTVVNPSAEVPVAFKADDKLGVLDEMRWIVSAAGIVPIIDTCRPPPGPNATVSICRFAFMVPEGLQSGQSLNLNVEATDVAGNVGRNVTTLVVGLGPRVVDFSPHEGPALGGSEFVIEGENFITGTQVFLGDVPIYPGGGTVVDDRHIKGMTPAHDPGLFPVVVRTGGASARAREGFAFIGAAVVLAVSPTSGSPAGGTPVAVVGKFFREQTLIRFGSEDFPTALPLLCPRLVSPNRIEGFTPPGVGAVSIFAFDPANLTSERTLAFTYLSDDSPDAEPPAPPPCLADGGMP